VPSVSKFGDALSKAEASRSHSNKTTRLRGAAKQANTRARDLELRIWTLLSQGKTPTAIAREVGIARQSVHRIIRRVESRYNESITATVSEMRARQARVLEATVDEALDAWERSKQPFRAIRKKVARAAGTASCESGDSVEQVETEIEMQVGDVRFLAEARAALADLRRLFGLDAPKALAGNGFESVPINYSVEWGLET
jgi:DNA-binding CsgD family transcriptional regulator